MRPCCFQLLCLSPKGLDAVVELEVMRRDWAVLRLEKSVSFRGFKC